MPGSVRENNDMMIEFVKSNSIKTILDVGTGRGTYSELLREHVDEIHGVEAWEPYIYEFDLPNKYDTLILSDVRDLDVSQLPPVDLVIFGDILEHMSKEDSIKVWTDMSYIAKWGVISVPVIHYPQGAEFGNPYEIHVQDHLTPEDIRDSFGPFDQEAIYEITGTFVKRFV